MFLSLSINYLLSLRNWANIRHSLSTHRMAWILIFIITLQFLQLQLLMRGVGSYVRNHNSLQLWQGLLSSWLACSCGWASVEIFAMKSCPVWNLLEKVLLRIAIHVLWALGYLCLTLGVLSWKLESRKHDLVNLNGFNLWRLLQLSFLRLLKQKTNNHRLWIFVRVLMDLSSLHLLSRLLNFALENSLNHFAQLVSSVDVSLLNVTLII